jgi:arylmalonate decarboxylase
VLGLILPAYGQGVAEAEEMYPGRARFEAEVIGLRSMSAEGYDAVVDMLIPAARALASRGAEAIVLMGTSLSFYRGPGFNARLREGMSDAVGLPALTMSDAIVAAMRNVGAKRVAAATAYKGEVNDFLRAYLEAEGFVVRSVCGLGIDSLTGGELDAVSTADLIELGVGVVEDAGADVDALLISCGGLRTLAALQPLEDCTGLPVVSSFPHALWAALQLMGVDASREGCGRVIARAASATAA